MCGCFFVVVVPGECEGEPASCMASCARLSGGVLTVRASMLLVRLGLVLSGVVDVVDM